MDVPFVVSLVVGSISIVLAVVAIWHSTLSERRSTENYIRTKDVLSEISQKSAAIEAVVNNTQGKLVDTVTAIASPKQESQEDIIMKTLLPSILQNPELMNQLMKLGEQQENTRS